MFINSITAYKANFNQTSPFKTPISSSCQQKYADKSEALLNFYQCDYLVNFGARTDKTLKGFYENTKDYMPFSVKAEAESALINNENVSPIEIQKRAYSLLSENNIDLNDLKEVYSEDSLFENIKPVEQSYARRGLLHDINVMKDMDPNINIFNDTEKNGNDITLYLLRKFFLEAKTFKEVNQDLRNDLNDVFTVNSQDDDYFVGTATLKSLGIALPDRRYLLSLLSTRDGWSDEHGQKIKDGWLESLKKFKELPREEQQRILAERAENRPPKSPLSEEALARRNAKLSQIAKENWENKTPEEKAAWIMKMMLAREASGSKYQSYAMINVWNNSSDIRTAMFDFFKERKTNIDSEKLINKDETTVTKEEMSALEIFWKQNPDMAGKFGDRITQSWKEIKKHLKNDTIDYFCREILAKQKDIQAEFENKKQLDISQQKHLRLEAVKQQFRENCKEAYRGYVDPWNIVKDFTDGVVNHELFSEKLAHSWGNYKNKYSKEEAKQLERDYFKVQSDVSRKLTRKVLMTELYCFLLLLSSKKFDINYLSLNYMELGRLAANINMPLAEKASLIAIMDNMDAEISEKDVNKILDKLRIERKDSHSSKIGKCRVLKAEEREIVARQIRNFGQLSNYIFDERCFTKEEGALKQALFQKKFLKTNYPDWPKHALVFNYHLCNTSV